MKQELKEEELRELLNILKGSLMIAYPGFYGIEDYEPAK
jgi:hypothetical protein